MPEQHRPNRNHPVLHLSHVRDNGSLIEARCHGCSPIRYYRPEDMITLFGDIPALAVERLMRCERCGRREMSMRLVHLMAAERVRVRVRRLDKVWTVRRASWRDE